MLDIIVSHQLTDFDGLGAMVAARKIYPAAKAVFVGRIHRLVKDFLVLYRDEIEVFKLKEIDLSKVDRVIIVDTYKIERLGDLKDKIDWSRCETVVYDHHPHDKLDWVTLDLSQEVGSATTILINKIIAESRELNPLEATICALAIYADTGNLTHMNTTAADARAVAYLLDEGANLKIINDFTKKPLNSKQEKLLEELLDNKNLIKIDGIEIALFATSYAKYIGGINRVTEKLKELYHLPSLFVVVKMGKKIEVIGRSSDEAVNIGSICKELGGGGHAGAGAASLEGELSSVIKRLKKIVNNRVQPVKSIREIMSSPVRTVLPDTSISEVEEIMKKYGHNGVVVYDGKVKGIFSRRDIDKVKQHNLMHAPVKAYMSKDLVTIQGYLPVHQAQDLMVKHGVGRLPVVEGGELLGIVTRSDILASYYGNETPYQHKNRYGSSLVKIEEKELEIRDLMDELPVRIIKILKEIGAIADKSQIRAYLIGGIIRDLLLGKGNNDIDIVVDGNPVELIKQLSDFFSAKVLYNEQFKTGSIKFADGLNIDLAGTRRENYHYPGALPEVTETNIFEDLFRRDYTINALAVALNSDKWGRMIDYFGGQKDLTEKKLRALHRFSFLDDPTRVIRGIRLASRLKFDFEKETEDLAREAVLAGDFSRLTSERIIKELELLFAEKINRRLLGLIKNIPVFKLLGIELAEGVDYWQQSTRLESWLEYLKEKNYNIEEWVLRLALFTDKLKKKDIVDWNLKERYKDILSFYLTARDLIETLDNDLDDLRLVDMLNEYKLEELVILLVKSGKVMVEKNIRRYINELKGIELAINGFDLKELGLNPGPVYKDIFDRVYRARLKGEVSTHQEELAYVKELLKERME
ncbi:CBS domain-containing protein [Halocella sp. SP3-1]|uniref:CBS domain-containing protein n=1 Tax=Halocella sp. SP3-1 TaxID=2382161 RepID=UPI000F759857|nr:CBS domain-containing protein [Halocella sp. SP3-1]AZO95608.1 CBS domain-containing protein [Halocella sp. SP3-1]